MDQELINKYTEAFKGALVKVTKDLTEDIEIKFSDGLVNVYVPEELHPLMVLIEAEIRKEFPDMGIPHTTH